MINFYYRLISDGSVWSVEGAKFVAEAAPEAELTDLPDVEELRKCLRFYNFPLGELADMNDLQNQFTKAIQKRLDDFARTRNYDDILSAATYAASAVDKFRVEGRYAVESRDATWAKGYEILNEVLAGQRPRPTLEEVLAELPILEWPA